MTDQTLRRVVGAMGTLLVIVLAATVLLLASRGGSGGTGVASASPSGSPSRSSPVIASASAAAGTTVPSATAGAPHGPSIAPGASPSPVPPASASAGVSPVPAAMLTFVGLKLDAEDDPAGEDRIITFTSDGAGKMSVKLVSQTPKGTTHMCFRAGTKELGCKDWSKGTFKGTTSQAHTKWRVTVRGSGIATPVVDVTVTYQVVKPRVKIANARFNGTAEPELNGIQVRFVPRADGDARLVASWGGHPFAYEIDTFDETTGGGPTYPNQGPSTSADLATPVTAVATWRLILQNIDAGFGTTDLTATISWP